jgi:replicative DNA helicase
MPLVKPHRKKSEKAIIKCLLQDKELYYTYDKQPAAYMFFFRENAVVFGVIKNLIDKSQQPDEILVSNTLKENGQFETIGAEGYFDSLEDTEVLLSNYPEYVDSVSESYLLREIISAGNNIKEIAYSGDVDEALEFLYQSSDRIFKKASSERSDSVEISDLLSEEFQSLLERIQNPGETGMNTLFEDYDLLTGGLYPTDEIIIAARPSMGKTSFMLRWMLNLAKQEIPCACFSYEMSKSQLIQRLLSMQSRVELSKIRTGRIGEDEYEIVAEANNYLSSLPMYFSNDVTAPVTQVTNEAKRLVRKHGIQAIFIDYLQLMPHKMQYATQELGSIVRQLKNLAMGSDISVITLSQLNRRVEQRQDKRPLLSDLRQSGNIEEHADVVLMLYREEMYNPSPQNKGDAELLIRKNRNGPTGSLPLIFKSEVVDFQPVEF